MPDLDRAPAGARDEGPRLARGLLRAYRHGAVGLDLWAGLTGQPARDLAEIDDAVRQLWDACFAAGLVPRSSVGDWSQTITRGLLHRWAWQPRWHLVDQDEDLLITPAATAATASTPAPAVHPGRAPRTRPPRGGLRRYQRPADNPGAVKLQRRRCVTHGRYAPDVAYPAGVRSRG